MDIDYLCYKHLTRHPNDKSGGVFAKLVGHLGLKEAEKAVEQMAQTLEISGLTIQREIDTWGGITRYPKDFIVVS